MKLRYAMNPKSWDNTFYVTGDSGTEYTVHHRRHETSHRKTWTCNCRDFYERRLPANDICKHIVFVMLKRFLAAYPAVTKYFSPALVDA